MELPSVRQGSAMKIKRLAIKNFRNFQNLDVRLHDHAVIVGPNAVGKSNLLHALRLVLDPSLPDSARHLRQEDFWDGVSRPLQKSACIEVVVELTDFEENDSQLASLAEYLVETEPMVARLTYVFRAKGTASDPPTPDEFEFFIFGGDREENRVGYEVRKRMPVDLFHALRDAEGDLATWRRSPLRPLLERAWSKVTKADKEALAKGVEDATALVTATDPLKALSDDITVSLAKHAGAQATDVQLGIGPKEAEALVRIVRLLLDGGQRGVGDASLGLANVLFFTLKLLELGHLVESHERDHTFVAIEEPEAHLHPHLQRQMFRSFLRLRPHLAKSRDEPLEEALPTTILLTTHSPHLASIAPVESLVLLRQVQVEVKGKGDGSTKKTFPATIATSTAEVEFDPKEKADLERYIEVSRGELLFARGVILVEGDAELYLVPAIARLHGVDLDKLGISVCSVGGTHFTSYVLLLKALGIPFAVITDGDPDTDRPGKARMYDLLETIVGEDAYSEIKDDDLLEATWENGLLSGDSTFELDLLHEGRGLEIAQVLIDFAPGKKARQRAEGWKNDPTSIDDDALLADISTIGKGRFAQRLATVMKWRHPGMGGISLQGPRYVIGAIIFIAGKLA